MFGKLNGMRNINSINIQFYPNLPYAMHNKGFLNCGLFLQG